jgi:hypothetical protein
VEEEGERETGGEKEEESEFLFCFRQRFFDAVQERRKEKKPRPQEEKKAFFLPLGLGLVVDHVKPDNVPQEQMELRVRRRVERGLEQGAEDVVDQVLEVADDALVAVDIVEPRDLDEPDDWCSFKRGTRGEREG